MKKILLSVSVIAVVAAVVLGVTTAFFSDTETSTGNTFTAGSLDLKISNTSYIKDHVSGLMVRSEGTSWTAKDLDGEKFFNFSDVKPGDVGEDTIDIKVIDNPAWACAKLTLTSNNDNGLTEPEGKVDTTDGAWMGELAQGIEFVWWADDGDNVLENNEEATKYYLGPASIMSLLGDDKVLDLTLADSVLNFFKLQYPNGGPLAGNVTHYIGKGWCYGDMTLAPVAQDGLNTGNPTTLGTGFICNGATAGNEGQTDSLTADIEFTVVQARNNAGFKCPEHQPRPVRYTSSNLNYNGEGGWAGWSCPAGMTAVGGGVNGNPQPMLAEGLAIPGAVIGGSTYPVFPHHTFGTGETGYVAQSPFGIPGFTAQIYVDCLAN